MLTRTPAMPIPLAHGANLLLLRLNATLSRMLRLFQLLCSHAPRLTSLMTSIMRNKKRRKIQASGDSSLECSNTDIEVVKDIKVVKAIEEVEITEVVKINQKDVTVDMVENITNNREVRKSKKVQETITDQELNQNKLSYQKVTWL